MTPYCGVVGWPDPVYGRIHSRDGFAAGTAGSAGVAEASALGPVFARRAAGEWSEDEKSGRETGGFQHPHPGGEMFPPLFPVYAAARIGCEEFPDFFRQPTTRAGTLFRGLMEQKTALGLNSSKRELGKPSPALRASESSLLRSAIPATRLDSIEAPAGILSLLRVYAAFFERSGVGILELHSVARRF